MHPDTVRGFRVAQGLQAGQAWFAIKSFVLGLVVLSGGIVGVMLLILLLHRGH
jgi:hypothetical protein